MEALMDLAGKVVDHLPAITDTVVYGSLCLTATIIYSVSFFGIVSTYYRNTNPLVPPTKALAAALILLTPVALVAGGLGALAERNQLYFVYQFSVARILACLCGTPLLLWLPAVALTAHKPFRDNNMPEPPLVAAAAGAEVKTVALGQQQVQEQEEEQPLLVKGGGQGSSGSDGGLAQVAGAGADSGVGVPEPAAPSAGTAAGAKDVRAKKEE